ncbi:MAG: hypothetical protein NUK65_09715 [Firmicutes bacterium]|nr:hypothetical protein [Bacillota bacterium]
MDNRKDYMEQWKGKNILEDVEKAVGGLADQLISRKEFSMILSKLNIKFTANSSKRLHRYCDAGLLPKVKMVNGQQRYTIEHLKLWIAIGLMKTYFIHGKVNEFIHQYKLREPGITDQFLSNIYFCCNKSPDDNGQSIIYSSLKLLDPKNLVKKRQLLLLKIEKIQKSLDEVTALIIKDVI